MYLASGEVGISKQMFNVLLPAALAAAKTKKFATKDTRFYQKSYILVENSINGCKIELTNLLTDFSP